MIWTIDSGSKAKIARPALQVPGIERLDPELPGNSFSILTE